MSSVCRAALLLSVLVLVLSLLSWQSTGAEEASVKPKNLSIQLPKIFDWDRYKASFQKIYPTIRDELARKKLFIASALKTFVHNLAFRLGKMRYFLSVNQFSDNTPEELKKMFSSFKPRKQAEGESSINGQSDEMQPLTGVDIERLEQMLARIVAEKQPGYRLLAQQLQVTIENHRSKRDVELSERIDDDGMQLRSGKTKKRSWQQVSKSDSRYDRRQRNRDMKIDEFRSMTDGEKPKESEKFVKRVPSTNPEHTPLELVSQAASTDGKEEGLPEQQLNLLEMIPNSVGYVKRQFNWLTDTFKNMVGEDEENDEDDPSNSSPLSATDSLKDLEAFVHSYESSKRTRLGYLGDVSNGSRQEDKVYLDYRQEGCLTIPRDQFRCGSCYAFAIVALMEWWHCKQTGFLVPFSEQYVVDCGRHVGLFGCNGGDHEPIERFIRDWGVELRSDYPYLARDSICPYEKDDWHRAGYKRPVVLSYNQVHLRALWPTALLLSGPLLAVLKVPEDFSAYGGLVHHGLNCNHDGYHAMLLVGHGVEDGDEYWLFRNSHGYYWGETGYFKLSKAASDECYDGFYETTLDYLRPPVGPIEVTEGHGRNKLIRKLTPYEAHHEGLLKF